MLSQSRFVTRQSCTRRDYVNIQHFPLPRNHSVSSSWTAPRLQYMNLNIPWTKVSLDEVGRFPQSSWNHSSFLSLIFACVTWILMVMASCYFSEGSSHCTVDSGIKTGQSHLLKVCIQLNMPQMGQVRGSNKFHKKEMQLHNTDFS